MRKIIAGIVFVLAFTVKGAFAQDFHLSQYDAAPLNLNPAMTGMFEGYYRIHAHYRTQWSVVSTKPYLTTGLSFDKPVKKLALGAQVMNYRAGAGNFNVFTFLVSGAYDMSIGPRKLHHVSAGLQAGFIQTSLDVSRLTFGTQFIPTGTGGTFDQNIPSGESVTVANSLIHDVNAGLMYYYANAGSRINPFLGASFFHLTQPDQSIIVNGASSKLPFRFNIHGGCKINISEKIQLVPKFLYMDQVNNKERTSSIIGHYYMKTYDAFLFFGPTFRNKDAAIFEGGLKYGKFTYGISYDVNTSSLIAKTNGRGGLEFSVTYVPKVQKPTSPICIRL